MVKLLYVYLPALLSYFLARWVINLTNMTGTLEFLALMATSASLYLIALIGLQQLGLIKIDWRNRRQPQPPTKRQHTTD